MHPEMSSWHSYPKIYAMGHRGIADILLDDVLVEEKLDGSQFSFGVFEEHYNGPDNPNHDSAQERAAQQPQLRLRIRSKGAIMHVDAPEKMFNKAVETVKSLFERGLLVPGWTYRAEYLSKPKHNTLAYDRAPNGWLAIFDINNGEESYLPYEQKEAEAQRLGLSVVPLVYTGRIATVDQFRSMLDRESFLGGQKIEGVVVKNYARFGADKKVLMGKFVSEAFKEAHTGAWREANPGKQDVVEKLVQGLATPARWAKAVQHLTEKGQLEGSPRDIGNLIKEAQTDMLAECREEIQEALMKWALPHIIRGSVRGLPEWYKEELLKKQFETDA